LIFRGLRDGFSFAEADIFMMPFLDDPATPPQGYAILGVSYAAMKRSQGDFSTMFAVFGKMVQLAPTHEWASAAYYWFALRSWKQGDGAQTASLAEKMLVALGNDWGMKWKQEMAAAALCLKAGLDLSQVSASAGIAVEELHAQLAVIQTDLSRINL